MSCLHAALGTPAVPLWAAGHRGLRVGPSRAGRLRVAGGARAERAAGDAVADRPLLPVPRGRPRGRPGAARDVAVDGRQPPLPSRGEGVPLTHWSRLRRHSSSGHMA